MGKTRNLFKEIRDTKGTFHAKMASIKDRNGMHLTETEAIKKRWQGYTEELYKKDLHNSNNHDGVITHLGPDILVCGVKQGLGSITTKKASEGNRIPVELFQILGDGAVSVFIPIPKKGIVKECLNYHTIALISHTSKVMLKVLQARLQQYMNCEIPDIQTGFRKGRGTRDQITNTHWIIETARVPEKHLLLLY